MNGPVPDDSPYTGCHTDHCSRFHKVFDIILSFNLRSAFWEWRSTARALKRQEMQLLDLTERCASTKKRQFFKVWLQNYRQTHAFKKTLRR